MPVIHVERLRPEDREEYENVVRLSTSGMRAHTLTWTRVLQRFTGAELNYLVAKVEGRIVGVLPSLMKKNVKYGNVLNSLPFFGTHGGPVVLPTLDEGDRLRVKKSLLLAFKDLAKENHCVFSTLITTPFECDADFIRETIEPSFVDPRITQMIVFPEQVIDVENEILYNLVEKRCRNAVRKAETKGLLVELAQDLKHVDRLIELHKQGMLRVNGIVKPKRFFDILFNEYADFQNKSFKVYYAWKGDKIIAALLLTCYKGIIDYFTPAFDSEYSDLQANTLLIYVGMKDAFDDGFNIWNFGGGARLSGVYNFKKSWGAKDYPYHYFINTYGDINEIRRIKQEEVLSEYEWFYAIPFTELNQSMCR